MRYVILLSTDFDKSVERFHPDDLRENMNAALTVARCITTQYNSHEWDSSVRFDVSMWTGYEMQLFTYGYNMARALSDRDGMLEFEDLINAYSIDENSAMHRPMWTFHSSIVLAHISYLMSVTQHPDYEMYRSLFMGRIPQDLPVPLPEVMQSRS